MSTINIPSSRSIPKNKKQAGPRASRKPNFDWTQQTKLIFQRRDVNLNKSKYIVSDTIGNDTIIININTGAYYSLTDAGCVVWKLIEEKSFEACDPNQVRSFIKEGLIEAEGYPAGLAEEANKMFTKYVDMEALLIADPIHEVDEQGWPKLR
jgi:hypothetical protein